MNVALQHAAAGVRLLKN